MIEMAAEANFQIDQLQIENECLINKTIDGKSSSGNPQSSINLGDYYLNNPAQTQRFRSRAGTTLKMNNALPAFYRNSAPRQNESQQDT